MVTFAARWPVIGLLLRDNAGQIWLGWADFTAEHFDVSWQCMGGPFGNGPLIQVVGSEAVALATSMTGDVKYTTLREPYEAVGAVNWTSLGLPSQREPVAVSWNRERIDVFGLGDDDLLWQTWLQRQHDGWAASRRSVPVAERVLEMPSAISWGAHRLDLFGRAADGAVLHKWWDDAADRLDIFTVENTSTTTHKYWHPGTGWLPAPPTQWEDVGGPLTTPPVVVTWGAYHLDIFGRGPEGHLRHLWWSPENGWEPNDAWEDMHGVLGSAPAAITWGSDRLGVFAVSVENTLIYKYRDPGITWRPSPTRWYESGLPRSGRAVPESLRASPTPSALAVVSVVEESLDHAHIGIFHP